MSHGRHRERRSRTDPFAPARLFGPEPEAAAESYAAPAPMVNSPFAEALASYDEAQLEAETFEALRAEFEDEDFVPALQALADEVAARHLTAVGSWSEAERGMQLSAAEAEAWLEAVADRSDRRLAELETPFGRARLSCALAATRRRRRRRTTLAEQSLGGPLDSQEMFLGKLVGKIVKVVKGVGKVVGKLALGPLFGVLRKLVRPLLQRVLQRAIGKLPPDQRPIAEKLRGRFSGKQPESAARGPSRPSPAAPAEPAEPAPKTTDSPPAPAADAATEPTAQTLAEDFDAQLAGSWSPSTRAPPSRWWPVMRPRPRHRAKPARTPALDAARQRLADQLIAADPAQPADRGAGGVHPGRDGRDEGDQARREGHRPAEGRRVHRQAAGQADPGHGRRTACPGAVAAHRERRAAAARPGGRAGRPDARRRGPGRHR